MTASSRSRIPLVVGAVLAVVVLAAIAAIVLTGGDDDPDAGDAPAAAGVDGDAFGVVTVQGDALPQGEGTDDPAVGTRAPTIRGTDYSGAETAIVPGEDGPLMVVVMAHWCPHCNREVPVILDWEASGGIPDDLRVVGVSTAVSAERPNFPPGAWLQDLGWAWPLVADDAEQSAAVALGVTGYPYLLFVDAAGDVVARVSGELPVAELQALADATVAA